MLAYRLHAFADVQGARSIRSSGIPALFVFIAPPSLEELERRLRGRGTETPDSMTHRIKNARQEISRCACSAQPALLRIPEIARDSVAALGQCE